MVKDNLRRGNEEVGRGEGDSGMRSIDRGNSKMIRFHACGPNQSSHPPSGLVLFTACSSPRLCSFSSTTLVISSRILLSFCPMQCDGKERERSSVTREQHSPPSFCGIDSYRRWKLPDHGTSQCAAEISPQRRDVGRPKTTHRSGLKYFDYLMKEVEQGFNLSGEGEGEVERG